MFKKNISIIQQAVHKNEEYKVKIEKDENLVFTMKNFKKKNIAAKIIVNFPAISISINNLYLISET